MCIRDRIFEEQGAFYYPFGYEHYLERLEKCQVEGNGAAVAGQMKAEDAALIAGMRAVPKAERHSCLLYTSRCV